MTRSLRFVLMAFVSLTAVALCSEAVAQRGFGGGGFGGGIGTSLPQQYARLLNSPTVQKELNLSDDQKAKISEAVDKARAAMGKMRSDMGDLSQEERQAQMKKIRPKMQAQAEETKKTIEGILQPKQVERLREIALQVVGVRAVNDKEVQKGLKLSDDQVAKIKTIGGDLRKKLQESRSEGGFDREKFQEMNKEFEKQLADVLTADQKAALEKMKGEKLDIPADELRGPGRRGGG